jgi:hypothetical protein
VEATGATWVEEAGRKITPECKEQTYVDEDEYIDLLTYTDQTNGRLEYHVPTQYTQSRPPINYTHITEHMALRQHHIGSRLPHATGKLESFGGNGFVRAVTDAESKPLLLEDYIYGDRPQLGLHIKNFNDATMITITWSHTLLDAMGRTLLLRAWQAMLEGRDDDVPDFVGYDEDLMADLGTDAYEAQEDFVLKPKLLGTLGMVHFIFNYLWEYFWYPVADGRMIAMPASYFARIKALAFADLETLPKDRITFTNPALSKSAGSSEKPFLSDGDILTAWLMRLIVRANPLIRDAPNRTVTVLNLFGMRDLLRTTSPALFPKHGAYIHNCISQIYSLFTAQEMVTLPLGYVAARLRADLVTQGSRAQMEAGQRLGKAAGGLAMYGDGGTALCTMTNWYKARLYETDFSAAVVGGAKAERSGKPAYIHLYLGCAKGFTVRSSGTVIGRDGRGNWWMGSIMRKEFLEGFERAVEEEGMLA